MAVDMSQFCHRSVGHLLVDPGMGTRHYEPWWALLVCDDEIVNYYAWLMKRWGVEIYKNSNWGAHVSFVRGEEPLYPERWPRSGVRVEFLYGNEVHWSNGRHAWLEVWCPTLTDVRRDLGLHERPANSTYHLTLGRLKLRRVPTRIRLPVLGKWPAHA